jgi:hypothetical protein
MTAPATLIPAAALGAAGAAYGYSQHQSEEEELMLAGSAAAVGLGAGLLYQEQNYLAGIPLILAGGLTALFLLKRR